jgi:predicted Zn-dependent protease
VIEQQHNILYRWPERIFTPLRIWVQPVTTIHDWRPEYAQAARDAFSEWSNIGIPVRFLFVVDSVNADVFVTWIDHFDEAKTIGRTRRDADRYGWLFNAGIVVALHTLEGETLPPDVVRATARHEVGHLLGLPHSPSPDDVMYPTVTVPDLSAADRATIRLLYTLPPGAAR